jgi:type I restriction enzyme S subunit
MAKYKKYKDSGIEWIGDIPDHWEVKKLKRELKFITGFTPSSGKSEYYENGSETWVTIRDMKGKYINDSSTKITLKAIEDYKPTLLPKNSLLYSFKLSVGKVSFNTTELYTNEAILAILSDKDINLNFFYYLLPLQLIYNANENIYGAKILNQELIKNTSLLIPREDEQKKIADYLDDKIAELNKLITKKNKLLELYKKEKDVIINQLVTKGINQKVKFKNSGIDYIGDIPENWKIKKLRYLGNCSNGISKSGDEFGFGSPFVSYSDVYKNLILPNDVEGLVNSSDTDKINYSILKGDVFFTRTSETVEEIGITSTCLQTIKDAVFAGFLIRFRPLNNILFVGFSKYYFSAQIHRRFFVKEMNLVTRASLSQELLKRLPVALPPIKEQKEIAKYLDKYLLKVESKSAQTKKYIDLLKKYKTALIREVVTGKIKIN